jgi:probable HAF family extracellular repeat protein
MDRPEWTNRWSLENGSIDPLTGWPEAVAVYWKDGQIVNLGTLGGNESIATAINNRSQIVGAAANTIPDPFPSPIAPGAPGYGTEQRAFLWEDGVMRDLGTLGGPDAVALLMNEQGQIVGNSYTSSTPNPSGIPTIDSFIWHNGKMIDLGSFGGTVTSPGWVNKRGQVVGMSNLPGDTTAHPFLWTEDKGMKDLGTLGGTFGLATWVNEAGEVVGTATVQGDQVQFAFLWKDGVMRNLGAVATDN